MSKRSEFEEQSELQGDSDYVCETSIIPHGYSQITAFGCASPYPIGILVYAPSLSQDGNAMRADIIDLYVAPTCRRQGAATALVRDLQSSYQAVHTAAATAEGEPLLRKLGFKYNSEAIDWCWTRP
jgi:ribosomal protein S18 acetylase RimI-like enzyme